MMYHIYIERTKLVNPLTGRRRYRVLRVSPFTPNEIRTRKCVISTRAPAVRPSCADPHAVMVMTLERAPRLGTFCNPTRLLKRAWANLHKRAALVKAGGDFRERT